MARRLCTILSALSLLSCAAVVVLWVWSYQATTVIGRGVVEGYTVRTFANRAWTTDTARTYWLVGWGKGRVVCMKAHGAALYFAENWPPGWFVDRQAPEDPIPDKAGTGVGARTGFYAETFDDSSGVGNSGGRVVFPFWFVITLLLIAPAAWFVDVRRNGGSDRARARSAATTSAPRPAAARSAEPPPRSKA